ncbi:tetratricopeptide repeat protein [Hymenobacter sp. J193]|nr:tetratricopeptide repeat protein [Hymenobacter sp. J193]MCR5890162.1 tetratricopeptide repeat protein [Hymenobacter sp. J193]
MKLFPRIALAAALGATAPLAAQAQQTQVFANDERFFQEGLELFDRAKYGAAQQAFQQYLELTQRRTGDLQDRTTDAEYYYAVAGLYLQHPDAEGRILAFAAHNPAHPKAAVAFFELGKSYFDRKSYPKAIEYLQRVAPDNLSAEQRAESEFKLGYSYFAQKDFDKARLQFDRNKQGQHQYRYASSYYAGYLAYLSGDFAGARKDLAVAEQNDAYRPVVPAVMTQIYYKEGDLDGLISYGTKALAQTPPPAVGRRDTAAGGRRLLPEAGLQASHRVLRQVRQRPQENRPLGAVQGGLCQLQDGRLQGRHRQPEGRGRPPRLPGPERSLSPGPQLSANPAEAAGPECLRRGPQAYV